MGALCAAAELFIFFLANMTGSSVFRVEGLGILVVTQVVFSPYSRSLFTSTLRSLYLCNLSLLTEGSWLCPGCVFYIESVLNIECVMHVECVLHVESVLHVECVFGVGCVLYIESVFYI